MKTEIQKKYIGYSELQSIYGIKRGTAYALVSLKQIPHIRLGARHVKFSVSDIEEWLQSHSVNTKQEIPPSLRAP